MHESSGDAPHLVAFGVFELDLRSGELRKSGVRLNLQHQPSQLLSVLLEQPGELVTRDELRKRLWPEDTFVDFEAGLNAAVKRLRDVLGDSADSPRFVETVPRRGYRFIAPARVPHGSRVPVELGGALRRRWIWGGIAAAAVAGALGFGLKSLLSSPAVPEAPRVAASTPMASGGVAQVTTGPYFTTEPALSPDGEWIAYASDRSGAGDLDIWKQRLSGGEPIRLTTDPADDREPTFSADGTRIAFRSERDGGGIYVMPAHTGGEATRLVGGGAHGPRFSPDGRWLAYSTGPGRFSTHKTWPHANTSTYLMAATGGPPVRLLPDFMSAAWPVWSPDGRHVLLTGWRERGVRADWWVTAVEGPAPATNAVRVTGSFTRIPARAWSWNEGNRIVYSAALDGDSWNLWDVAISPGSWTAAGEPRRLTTAADSQTHAAVAQGTRQLVFASLVETVNIWSVPVHSNGGRAAGPPQRVTATAPLQMCPTASDDGRRLVFWANRPATGGLWVKDLDTNRETLLLPTRCQSSAISTDASRVAYVSESDGTRKISAAPTSGGVPETLCVDCSPVGVCSWSRDGTRLLYLTGSPVAVWLLDLRSGDSKPLLRRPHDLWQSKFSPDERWISVVEVHASDRTRVWVAPFNEAATPSIDKWVQITSGEFWDDKPRWSPDGSVLHFTSLRDGFHCLWAHRLRPDTKQPIGTAFAVQHFHSARVSMNHTGFAGLGTSVARDRIYVNLGEVAGNIWTTQLR